MKKTKISFHYNKKFYPILTSKAFEIDITGGRGRGGSHFGTDYFLNLIMFSKYFRGYFMRLIHSDIRTSLYQDFKDRIEEKEEEFNVDLMQYFHFNDNNMSITYIPNGNKIESKGFRKSSNSRTAKMKSIAGATHILIEEFEEIEEHDYRKLSDSLRTKKVENLKILRVWNPPQKDHWILKTYYNLEPHPEYDEYFTYTAKGVPGHECYYSTYTNNIENINKETIRQWEGYKNDERTLDHYLTDIKGLVSSGAKGQIYKNWKLFETLPDIPLYRVFGLDWGGTDPTALIECLFDKKNKRVFLIEHLYNDIRFNDLSELLKRINPNNDEIVCDSSRRDSRIELSDRGHNVLPADKTKITDDFRMAVIEMVRQYEMFVYHKSENLIFELSTYKWAINHATKEPLNKPEDKNNHLCDSLAYATRYYHHNYNWQYNQD